MSSDHGTLCAGMLKAFGFAAALLWVCGQDYFNFGLSISDQNQVGLYPRLHWKRAVFCLPSLVSGKGIAILKKFTSVVLTAMAPSSGHSSVLVVISICIHKYT